MDVLPTYLIETTCSVVFRHVPEHRKLYQSLSNVPFLTAGISKCFMDVLLSISIQNYYSHLIIEEMIPTVIYYKYFICYFSHISLTRDIH